MTLPWTLMSTLSNVQADQVQAEVRESPVMKIQIQNTITNTKTKY